MIETPVRSRKDPLKPIKMEVEDIKIEFVDLCVMPADGMNIFEMDSDDAGSSTEMEMTLSSTSSPGETVRPRKRAKLDHLSPEEKAQHRKMMNRISAQSARDRQKALMMQQETTIKNITAASDSLKKQNAVLVSTTETLSTENKSLKEENERLSNLVAELEAKLKATSENPPQVADTSAGSTLQGTTRAASEFVSHASSLDIVPWDLDSPELMQILGEFSEKILSGEQQLPELEQLNPITEAIVAQMAAQAKTVGHGAEDSGLTMSVVYDDTIDGSQNSTSATDVHNSSSIAVTTSTDASLKTQVISLPLIEPDTLHLPQINLDANHGPVSPVPATVTVNADITIAKHENMSVDDDSNYKYVNEISELYDSWNSNPLDSDLFPELDMF
ncbi:X-box-binding protein 1 [Orchesella cincta]|uniref:X-box-binding protein 1 n=1 Tax=Orchesella cincta TaxID=48709 RepID=A0A1D2MYM4_ORCCI|nr:X-box-binding protein 1 [Orchesella cincta]